MTYKEPFSYVRHKITTCHTCKENQSFYIIPVLGPIMKIERIMIICTQCAAIDYYDVQEIEQ